MKQLSFSDAEYGGKRKRTRWAVPVAADRLAGPEQAAAADPQIIPR